VRGPIDGNAFCILGAVAKAMKDSGYSRQQVDEMLDRAMDGNYKHLLAVCMEYVDFQL
jgi:hypothetical protein